MKESTEADPRTRGARIRAARDRLGITQDDLAHAIGVKPHTVSRWERNAHMPEAKHLPDLARALSVDLTWLLEGDSASAAE